MSNESPERKAPYRASGVLGFALLFIAVLVFNEHGEEMPLLVLSSLLGWAGAMMLHLAVAKKEAL